MAENRIEVAVGDMILTDDGTAVVLHLDRAGVQVRDVRGTVHDISWTDLTNIDPVTPDRAEKDPAALRSFAEAWGRLSAEARDEAMFRLGVVLEIVTGFRHGHPQLALAGEPATAFDPVTALSVTARCERMAAVLRHESSTSRLGDRDFSTITGRALLLWVNAWSRDGLIGLVDGRRAKTVEVFSTIPLAWRQAAHDVIAEFDGDVSTVNFREIRRRIRARLRDGGHDIDAPQRASTRYISHLMARRGATTRAQRSNKLRGVSGSQSYPAMVPGQVVAIDVTRSDVMVWCPDRGGACSVEIITAICLATRTVQALRVVPMSADAHDAAMLMYDVMRPFSMLVDGTTVTDWAWAGVPQQIEFYADAPDANPDCSGVEVTCPRTCRSARVAPGLQGEHMVPGVRPAVIRADHGSIFVSQVFRDLLRRFGIDIAYSRTRRPIDNGVLERWHETVQRALQQLPGYKGRNPSQRGRRVGLPGSHQDEPLLTAAELERFLRRWVALDYHRTPHSGLHLPGAERVDLTPIELFDGLLKITGRLHVPQRPDLVYDFLPQRWGTVGPAGVEFADLVYDSPHLNGLRAAPAGTFRPEDRAMPFMYDPHDVTRIWFRHPDTRRVVEVPWRKAHLTQAPLIETLAQHVRAVVRRRPGGAILSATAAEDEIVKELGNLVDGVVPKDWKKRISAARLRFESSRRNHTEAEVAMTVADIVAATAAPAPEMSVMDDDLGVWADSWPFTPPASPDPGTW